MTRQEKVKAIADSIGCTPEELIESVVYIFCDRATNKEDIIEQLVQRYRDFGPLPDYLVNYCETRLAKATRPMMSEAVVAQDGNPFWDMSYHC